MLFLLKLLLIIIEGKKGKTKNEKKNDNEANNNQYLANHNSLHFGKSDIHIK